MCACMHVALQTQGELQSEHCRLWYTKEIQRKLVIPRTYRRTVKGFSADAGVGFAFSPRVPLHPCL